MPSLGSISEIEPLSALEASVQASEGDLSCLQSPVIMQNKKRQRRLTLTAMTGALGDIPQDDDAWSFGKSMPGAQPQGGAVFVTPRTRTRSDSTAGDVAAQSPANGAFKLSQTPDGLGACPGFLGATPSPARGHISAAQSPAGDMFQRQPSMEAFQRQPSVEAFQRQPSVEAFQRQPSMDAFQRQEAFQRQASVEEDLFGASRSPVKSAFPPAGGYGPLGVARSPAGGPRRPRRAEVGGAGIYGSPTGSAFSASMLSPVGLAFTPPHGASAFQSPMGLAFTPLHGEGASRQQSAAPTPHSAAPSLAFETPRSAAPRSAAGSPMGGAWEAPGSEPRPGGAVGAAPGGFELSRSPTKAGDDARDNSPNTGPRLLPGFKRTRDSIGPDLSPEVMMRRAAQKFTKPSLKRSASSSSNSEEDDERTIKSQRRQQAFEYGLKAAEGPGGPDSWATTVGAGVALSPRSFARGCKAAEVAARVEEQMKKTKTLEETRLAEEARVAQMKPVPDSPSPRKRPNPLLRKAYGS